jgi:hypothetical protein
MEHLHSLLSEVFYLLIFIEFDFHSKLRQIRALLRVANGDSQPNVLEAAGKAQSAWLSAVDSVTGERST